jgi:hypothetical protein
MAVELGFRLGTRRVGFGRLSGKPVASMWIFLIQEIFMFGSDGIRSNVQVTCIRDIDISIVVS